MASLNFVINVIIIHLLSFIIWYFCNNILFLLFFHPKLLKSYLTKRYNNELIEFDYDDFLRKHLYFIFDDKIDFTKFNNKCSLCDFKDYEKLLPKNILYGEKKFNFNNLDYDVAERFIALLSSLTLNLFKNCNKNYYYRTLNCRGIEYSMFKIGYKEPPRPRHTLLNPINGKLTGQIYYKKHLKFMKYLVIKDVLSVFFASKKKNKRKDNFIDFKTVSF